MCACSGFIPLREMNVKVDLFTKVGRRFALSTDHDPSGERFECEHTCWDPKEPGETLVEARRDSNVQIDRRT